MTPSARLEINYQGLIDWGPTAPAAFAPGGTPPGELATRRRNR